MSSRKNLQILKIPSSVTGQSTVIIPTKPMFCIDINSIPKDAVVAKSTVAFAVTWHDENPIGESFHEVFRASEAKPFDFHMTHACTY